LVNHEKQHIKQYNKHAVMYHVFLSAEPTFDAANMPQLLQQLQQQCNRQDIYASFDFHVDSRWNMPTDDDEEWQLISTNILYYAAFSQNEDLVRFILQEYPFIDVNAGDGHHGKACHHLVNNSTIEQLIYNHTIDGTVQMEIDWLPLERFMAQPDKYRLYLHSTLVRALDVCTADEIETRADIRQTLDQDQLDVEEEWLKEDYELPHLTKYEVTEDVEIEGRIHSHSFWIIAVKKIDGVDFYKRMEAAGSPEREFDDEFDEEYSPRYEEVSDWMSYTEIFSGTTTIRMDV
jgi:hypothetical protein